MCLIRSQDDPVSPAVLYTLAKGHYTHSKQTSLHNFTSLQTPCEPIHYLCPERALVKRRRSGQAPPRRVEPRDRALRRSDNPPRGRSRRQGANSRRRAALSGRRGKHDTRHRRPLAYRHGDVFRLRAPEGVTYGPCAQGGCTHVRELLLHLGVCDRGSPR